MRFKIFYLYFALSIFMCSCSKDELKDVELLPNVYDNSTNVEHAVEIDAFRIMNYNVVNGDTTSVKIEIDVTYSSDFYNNNDATKPKIRSATLLYLNDVNIPRTEIPNTNTIKVEQPYDLLKNKTNYFQFKIKLVVDNDRIRVASKPYYFNLN